MISEFRKFLLDIVLLTPPFTYAMAAEFLAFKLIAVLCGMSLAIGCYWAFRHKAGKQFLWLIIVSVSGLALALAAYQYMFANIPEPSGRQRSVEYVLYFLVNLNLAFIVILSFCLAPAKLLETIKGLFGS